MSKTSNIAVLVLWTLLCGTTAYAQTPAFPGAEGHGAYTTGGRGGAVIEVTNLENSGIGSLRQALNATGPRTIVFRVSGTIELLGNLTIKNGDVTIAGQTAPGEGICLKNYPLVIDADNVIIRYIRCRLGDEMGTESDAMSGRNQKNIIIDHCSMSWSVDEAASFYDNENFTLQWCIISESLYHSLHGKGNHGYGGIWGGMNASFHHNLLAHHTSRNPRFCGSRYHGQPEREIVDFRNNVLYNWGGNSAYGGEQGNHNMVNNYYKWGPATSSSKKNRIVNPSDAPGTSPMSQWFVEGNYVDGFPDITADNWAGGVQPDGTGLNSLRAAEPFPTGDIVTQTPEDAYRDVLLYAGAILPVRDEIDERIVNETSSRTAQYGASYGANKGIIDTPSDVGGWVKLSSLEPPADTDVDGMPDEWEDEKGLDKNDPSDRNLRNDLGYTNLEVYLNSIVAGERIIEVGVDDLTVKTRDVRVFPNPASSQVSVQYSVQSLVPATLEIVDLSGRVLKRKVVHPENKGKNLENFELTGLQNGMYLVKVRQGTTLDKQKLMIQR